MVYLRNNIAPLGGFGTRDIPVFGPMSSGPTAVDSAVFDLPVWPLPDVRTGSRRRTLHQPAVADRAATPAPRHNLDAHGFITDTKLARSEMADPQHSFAKTAYVNSLVQNYAVLSKQTEFYRGVKTIFDRLFTEAVREDPLLKEVAIDLILVDSPHLNAFANRAHGLVIVDMTFLRWLDKNGLLTADHIAYILGHEIRHLSQDNSDEAIPVQAEFDADHFARIFASRAGYNPNASNDVLRCLHEDFPSGGGFQFLKSHPKSLLRLEYAMEFASKPLAGQDQPYQTHLPNMPGKSAARDFQEELAQLRDYDEKKVLDLIARATTVDQVLMVTHKMQDMAKLALARHYYATTPWQSLLAGAKAPNQFSSDAQFFWPLFVRIAQTKQSPDINITNREYPGTNSQPENPQSIAVYSAYQGGLVDVADRELVQAELQKRPAIEELIAAMDSKDSWRYIIEELPKLKKIIPENAKDLSLTAKTEILQRLVWIGCYELAFAADECFRPLNWHVQCDGSALNPPDVIATYPLPANMDWDLRDRCVLGVSYKTGTALRKQLKIMTAARGALANKFRDVLSDDLGIVSKEAQDFYIATYAGIMAGDSWDIPGQIRQQWHDLFAAHPRADFLKTWFRDGLIAHSVFYTADKLLSCKPEVVPAAICRQLSQFSIYTNTEEHAGFPFSQGSISLSMQGQECSPKEFVSQLSCVEQSLQDFIAKLQAKERREREQNGKENAEFFVQQIAQMQELCSKLQTLMAVLPEFVELVNAESLSQAIPIHQIKTLSTRMRYAESPVHETEGNKSIRVYQSRAVEQLRQLTMDELVGFWAQILDEEAQDNVAQEDPLGGMGIGWVLSQIGREGSQREETLVNMIFNKLMEGKNEEAYVVAVARLPAEKQRRIIRGFRYDSGMESLLRKAVNDQRSTQTGQFPPKITALMQRLETAHETHALSQPLMIESLLNVMDFAKWEPSSRAWVQRYTETRLESLHGDLRKQNTKDSDLVKRTLDNLYGMTACRHRDDPDYILNHPVLQHTVPYFCAGFDSRFDPWKAFAPPLSSEKIVELAKGMFGEASVNKWHTRYCARFSGNDKTFAHFLFPIVFSDCRFHKFASLEEAFFAYLNATANPPPPTYVTKMMDLLSFSKSSEQIFDLVLRTRGAFLKSVTNQGTLHLGRAPTADEFQAFVAYSGPTYFDAREREQTNPEYTTIYGLNHGQTLEKLSLLLLQGGKTGGLERDDLRGFWRDLSSELAKQPDRLDQPFTTAYSLDAQHPQRGDNWVNFGGQREGGYTHFALIKWRAKLENPIHSVEQLRLFAKETYAELSPIDYQESYDLQTRPFEKSSEPKLKVDPYYQKWPNEIEKDYCQRRQPAATTFPMSDFFLEHNPGELQEGSLRKRVADLLRVVETQLGQFDETELSSFDKITLLCELVPMPCLERDAVIMRFVAEAPANFLDAIDCVALVTGHLLTAFHRDQLGQRCFTAWVDTQNTQSLKSMGVDGIVDLLTKFFPQAGFVRDDAIGLLLNGSAERHLDWVTGFSEYDKLIALKQDAAPRQPSRWEAPTDLTNGMFLLDWVDAMSATSKEDLFYYLVGKRALPPTELLGASLSQSAANAQHFETLKAIVTESGKGVFVAHMMTLLAGKDGLINPYRQRKTPANKVEEFVAHEAVEGFLQGMLEKLELTDVLPKFWHDFFVSFFVSKPPQAGARVLSEVLYRLHQCPTLPDQDQLLTIFISACGFEAIKFAQIVSQQSQLIADPQLRQKLADFQSLPVPGDRAEAFEILRLWARQKGIRPEDVQLGTLIARASAGQVYEVSLRTKAGAFKRFGAKFVLQRNRYGLVDRIEDLEKILTDFKQRSGLDFEVPGYLLDTLSRETELELSLNWEAEALERMRVSVAKIRLSGMDLRVPKPQRDLSTNWLMLMDLIEDRVTLKDLIRYANDRENGTLDKPDPELELLLPQVDRILKGSRRLWAKQVGWEHFYHGDLHPGNILVGRKMEQGRPVVYWLDAANAKNITSVELARNLLVAGAVASPMPDLSVLDDVLAYGISLFYPDTRWQNMRSALQAGRVLYRHHPGFENLLSAYQEVVLRLASGNGAAQLGPDLGLMTALSKASLVLKGKRR